VLSHYLSLEVGSTFNNHIKAFQIPQYLDYVTTHREKDITTSQLQLVD
jgi:hypothetical protein